VRIGELLHSRVVDVGGRSVGRVHDVRLVREGERLRVDGLVVGKGALAIRLGYHRAGVQGPFLLGRIFRAIEGRARYVPWERVADRSGDHLRLSCSTDDLPTVPDLG
jgi:sporulation protein YlmC with PRC-barrel domain